MERIRRNCLQALTCAVCMGLSLSQGGCGSGTMSQGGDTTATADVIPPARRTTWNPGLNAFGGIPYRTTIYTTINPSSGDDTAAIQTALNNCPANQVVKLGPGTFKISGQGLIIDRSKITLRGGGVTTRLVKALGTDYPVIIVGLRWPGSTQPTNLAANGVKGSKTVTLANDPGLQVGEIVYVDQLTNASLTRWSSRSPPGDPSRGWFSRYDRPIAQVMEVESISGTTVTFTAPFHIDFLTAYTAQLVRKSHDGDPVPMTKWSGIEDLYVYGGEGGDGGGNIHLFSTAYSWVKNVESDYSNGTGINLDGTFRCEVRDSYIHTAANPNPGGGGYLLGVNGGAADNLVENNIVWNGNKVIVMRVSGGGNVIGYNYMEDAYGAGYKSIVEVGLNASHMTTPHMELFEGNQSFNFDSDSVWGNSIYITAFRNHLTAMRRSLGGLGLLDDGNRRAIGLTINHWWYNFAGNVLGTQGQTLLPGQTSFGYETSNFDRSVVPMWKLGYDGEDGNVPQDATVAARTLRHGNFDYVTNSVVWDPANADHNLPPSLYLTSKPAFFGNSPWPWVDPTGAIKLHALPARARFDAGTPFAPPPGS